MRALSFVIALIGVALLAAGTADAHKFKYTTKVKLISGGPAGAKEKVNCTSKRCPTRCVKHRKVTLLKDEPGKDKVFGVGYTTGTGAFTINAPLIQGEYYATVASTLLLNTQAHNHSCGPAVSLRVQF